MDGVLLDNLEFTVDLDQLFNTIKMDPTDDDADTVIKMAKEAQSIARPKALYKIAYIEEKGDNFVVINGVKFISRVMSVNLKDVHRVFPFVVTCGVELEDWSNTISDMLERYWADAIKIQAMNCAFKAMETHLEEHVKPGKTACMNPGSLEDWPISEQTKLFKLLGDVRNTTGVLLTDSFLMVPVKSVSGIKFPTETDYENCQLCPRENCPGRRAPYDKDLYAKKYL
ncbi:MAG TPA: vitamin B12 dependent methionine synthase [Clostridiaceae bacterium]|nr:vitamin B12 dependent methionine synthase [Clostridiaceae bacterium]